MRNVVNTVSPDVMTLVHKMPDQIQYLIDMGMPLDRVVRMFEAWYEGKYSDNYKCLYPIDLDGSYNANFNFEKIQKLEEKMPGIVGELSGPPYGIKQFYRYTDDDLIAQCQRRRDRMAGLPRTHDSQHTVLKLHATSDWNWSIRSQHVEFEDGVEKNDYVFEIVEFSSIEDMLANLSALHREYKRGIISQKIVFHSHGDMYGNLDMGVDGTKRRTMLPASALLLKPEKLVSKFGGDSDTTLVMLSCYASDFGWMEAISELLGWQVISERGLVQNTFTLGANSIRHTNRANMVVMVGGQVVEERR